MSLSSSSIDSLGEGIDLGVKSIDLSIQDGNLLSQSVSDVVVFFNLYIVYKKKKKLDYNRIKYITKWL